MKAIRSSKSGDILDLSGPYNFLVPNGIVIDKSIKVRGTGAKLLGAAPQSKSKANLPNGAYSVLSIVENDVEVTGLEIDGQLPIRSMIGSPETGVAQASIDTYGVLINADNVLLRDCFAHHAVFPVLIGAQGRNIQKVKLQRVKAAFSGQNASNASPKGDLALGSCIAAKGTYGGALLKDITIENCQGYSGAYCGVELEPMVTDSRVSGRFYGNRFSGIICVDCDFIDIAASCYNNVEHGMKFINCSNIQISGNSYLNNFHGIAIEARSSSKPAVNIRVVVNSYSNGGSGIACSGSQPDALRQLYIESKVAGNSTKFDSSGISVDGATGVVLSGESTGSKRAFGLSLKRVRNARARKLLLRDNMRGDVDSTSRPECDYSSETPPYIYNCRIG
jgi:hypothetical protein